MDERAECWKQLEEHLTNCIKNGLYEREPVPLKPLKKPKARRIHNIETTIEARTGFECTITREKVGGTKGNGTISGYSNADAGSQVP